MCCFVITQLAEKGIVALTDLPTCHDFTGDCIHVTFSHLSTCLLQTKHGIFFYKQDLELKYNDFRVSAEVEFKWAQNQ